MDQIRGGKIVLNGEPAAASGYSPDAATGFYYEVIRVMDGRFLFLADHLNRLQESCRKATHECPGNTVLKEYLSLLLRITNFNEGNVKVILYVSGRQLHCDCYFIPHSYPTTEQYRNGIEVRTFRFTRPDPNVKKWNELFRSRVDIFIRENHIYEAILVNEQGYLTEGSRSNLFFTGEDGTLYTPPLDVVLPGITRKYITSLCSEMHIQVIEKPITLEEAGNYRGCFLSGTSPKVLPVSRLNHLEFNPDDPLIRKIMRAYDELIRHHMES